MFPRQQLHSNNRTVLSVRFVLTCKQDNKSKLGHPGPGAVNTGTLPSRLGKSRIWDSKMWLYVPRDSDPRVTALARESSNCKRYTRPPAREGGPHQQTRNCLILTKIWSWAPDAAWHQDKTGRRAVGCNIILTLNKSQLSWVVCWWVS
jgi:hypothetical protein